jgi:simple sugar transport system permease protein
LEQKVKATDAAAAGTRPWRQAVSTAGSETLRILLAIGISLLLAALLLSVFGYDPLAALSVLVETVFFTWSGFIDTMLQTVPLLMIALGYVIAFRARVWMVGGEGQFHVGASAAGVVALTLPATTPGFLAVLLAMAAAMLAGIVWALVPGVLRVRRQVNEVVSTLMLNFVGILVMSWLIRAVLPDPLVPFMQTEAFPRDFLLPTIAGTRLHLGILFVLVAAVVVAYLADWSVFGARARAIGANADAARAAGIDVSRTIILMFVLGGALAGLAAAFHVLGASHRLLIGLSNNYGYTAIMVVLLARNHPLGVVPAAFFFSALIVGSEGVQVDLRIPRDFVLIFMGMVVFILLAGDAMLRRRSG